MEKHEIELLKTKVEKIFQEEKNIISYLETITAKYAILSKEDYEDDFLRLAEFNAEIEIACLVNNKTQKEMNDVVINFLLENEILIKELLLIHPIDFIPNILSMENNIDRKFNMLLTAITNFSNVIFFLREQENYRNSVMSISELMDNEKELFYKRNFNPNDVITLSFYTLVIKKFYDNNLFLGMSVLKSLDKYEKPKTGNLFKKFFGSEEEKPTSEELRTLFNNEISSDVRKLFFNETYNVMLEKMVELISEVDRRERKNPGQEQNINEKLEVLEMIKTITEGIDVLLTNDIENSTLHKVIVNSRFFKRVLSIFDNEGR